MTEAASIARSIALKSGQRIDGNQEFIGQGLANIVGAQLPIEALLPILAGLSTNTISKIILAATAGGRAFEAGQPSPRTTRNLVLS